MPHPANNNPSMPANNNFGSEDRKEFNKASMMRGGNKGLGQMNMMMSGKPKSKHPVVDLRKDAKIMEESKLEED